MTRLLALLPLLILLPLLAGPTAEPVAVTVRRDGPVTAVSWSPAERAVILRRRAGGDSLVAVADTPPLIVAGGDEQIRLNPCDLVRVELLDPTIPWPRPRGAAVVPWCTHLPLIGRR